MNKLKTFLFRLIHSCYFSDGFLYWFYTFIVRTLDCKCCIFYRGLAVGFFLGMVWAFVILKLLIWIAQP